MHISQMKKEKNLDDKSEKCIFLGVSETSKTFKLLNPLTNQIVTSRDVVFNEERIWDWNGQQPTPIILDDEIEKEEKPTEISENNVPKDEESSITSEIQSPTSEAAAASAQSSLRIRKRPAWMKDYEVTGVNYNEESITHFALYADCDPTTFESAVKESKWREAMDVEIEAIERNDTWQLCDLPKVNKTIGVKWVFKTKLKENSEVDKYKARLVAKGYEQEYGVDYTEIFTPVARHDTIRLVVAMAAQNSWPILQLDVKSTFLHGTLEKQIFIDQPPGYIKIGHEHKVYKLKKALYGLKQAPRAWYSRIETYFLKNSFQKCPYEHSLFVKIGNKGQMLIVCLYVDDLIFTGNDSGMFEKFKKSMIVEFEMSDLGKMHYFLGLEVVQSKMGFFCLSKEICGRNFG